MHRMRAWLFTEGERCGLQAAGSAVASAVERNFLLQLLLGPLPEEVRPEAEGSFGCLLLVARGAADHGEWND